jgi:hypothetical protein
VVLKKEGEKELQEKKQELPEKQKLRKPRNRTC